MTKKKPSVVGFLVGILVGVLMTLAGLMFRPVMPIAAVGAAVCGSLAGLVVVFSDGSLKGLDLSEVEGVEQVLGWVDELPTERKLLIEMGACAKPGAY